MGSQLSTPQSKCTVTVRIDDSSAANRQKPADHSTIECSLEFPLNDCSFVIDIINDYPDSPAKKSIREKKENGKDSSNTLGLWRPDKGADPRIFARADDEEEHEPLLSSSKDESSVPGAGSPILTPSSSSSSSPSSSSSDTSTGSGSSSSSGTLCHHPIIKDNSVRGMLLVIKVMTGGIQKMDMDSSSSNMRGCFFRGIHGWK
jgi:hypothetical protein